MTDGSTATDGVDPAAKAAILAAVEAGFERQVAMLADFVSIPSTRNAESPAQDFMADALRARGMEVDDWPLVPDELSDQPGWGPMEGWDGRARTVVGTHRPAGPAEGRSLILQGHCDVVPAGPAEMWTTPPYRPAIRDGWMHGRGAGDMKSGTLAALFALDALRDAGFEPAGRVHFQSVIEEEATGLGALATLARGYRADCVLIPEPTDRALVRAQVGVMWFRLRVRGRPVHVAVAGEGSNAILAAYDVVKSLQGLEAEWNARAAEDPLYHDVHHPLNFNAGKIAGGDWASSVPAWCDVDCRIGVLPGWDLGAAMAEVEARVAEAARAHPFLGNNPPEVVWNGFRAEGFVLEDADEEVATFAAAGRDVWGEDWTLPETKMTALTDTRFYGLYHGIPALCFGPRCESAHGFDERVELASVKETTAAIAMFVARWCGLNRIS